jgi:outer membrane protein
LQTQLSYDNSKYKELRKKYDMKLANKMDMLQSEVILNSSKINLQNEKQTYAVYEMKLKQFIGNVDIELPELDCDQSIIIDMINVIRRAKMANKISVKLKEAQINIEISRADVKSAFSGHLPNVTFDASYGKFQTDDPTTDVQYDNIQSIMLNVNIPIYSGGYTSSSVAAAELRQKASSEDFFNAKKEMQLEYNKNLTLFETSSDSIFMYEQATESAEVYVKAIEEGYKHGLKTIADFDDAKVKHYDVKYKYIDNMSQFIDAYIGLLIVTNDIENIGLLDKLIIK